MPWEYYYYSFSFKLNETMSHAYQPDIPAILLVYKLFPIAAGCHTNPRKLSNRYRFPIVCSPFEFTKRCISLFMFENAHSQFRSQDTFKCFIRLDGCVSSLINAPGFEMCFPFPPLDAIGI